MKNTIRLLSTIAIAGAALAAASSPTFAAVHRAKPVSHKAAVMRHKKAPKKQLINFERGKTRKHARKITRKSAVSPVIGQS
jgi:hypothetical protein